MVKKEAKDRRTRRDGVRQQQAVQHQNGLNRQHDRRNGNGSGSGSRVRGRGRSRQQRQRIYRGMFHEQSARDHFSFFFLGMHMQLRDQSYLPSHYWRDLHYQTGPFVRSPTAADRASAHHVHAREPEFLRTLTPHVQQTIYREAIDKRKGQNRNALYPLSPAQYRQLEAAGLRKKYAPCQFLLQTFRLRTEFRVGDYRRAAANIQFRLFEKKTNIENRKWSAPFLRMRFQQKAAEFIM
ncbi:unnamed protein product [Didymodactylos carnosus]|uniref:Uncharacterized protein n=1 Tax=Didymodactylos carnosus TaxID=1234261 RepID=A0A8S2VI10_9BILA|nr:unnamed protein product [Didymodactylos carnosus]CAF4371833.1 unnamed protein product [Didymodactylos carnosus]